MIGRIISILPIKGVLFDKLIKQKQIMERRNKLSRRDFLKLGGMSAGSLATDRLVKFSNKEENDVSFERVIFSFNTDRPIYALTIDDGWIPEAMDGMIDVLKEKHMRASFFLVGVAVMNLENRRPGIMKRIIKDGHSIGYHTMKHPEPDFLEEASYKWWEEDFNKWWKLMRYYLGADLAIAGLRRQARAPYGLFTDEFKELCERKSLGAYGWNIGVASVLNGKRLKKGDMLLLHVANKDLEVLKNGIKTQGKLIGTSIDCLENEDMCQSGITKYGELEKDKWERLFEKLEKTNKYKQVPR
jgi:peptidoglycan/xylan/chitin deacetylase (PgdA/CDA1 family)